MRLDDYSAEFRPDIAAGIDAMPSTRWLGLRCIGFAPGRSAIEMPIRPELTFDGRNVQGAIVGVLADYAAISSTSAAVGEDMAALTAGFTLQNIAPARGERLVALGRVVSHTRSSAVGASDVYAVSGDDWTLVATCLASSRLVDRARFARH